MIDYEEELKKFEPCLDVADVEGVIYDREITDLMDVLQEMLREVKSNKMCIRDRRRSAYSSYSTPLPCSYYNEIFFFCQDRGLISKVKIKIKQNISTGYFFQWRYFFIYLSFIVLYSFSMPAISVFIVYSRISFPNASDDSRTG